MLKPIYITFLDERSDVDFQVIPASSQENAHDIFISMPSNVDYRILNISNSPPTLDELMRAA